MGILELFEAGLKQIGRLSSAGMPMEGLGQALSDMQPIERARVRVPAQRFQLPNTTISTS